jgi:hypothetical protein
VHLASALGHVLIHIDRWTAGELRGVDASAHSYSRCPSLSDRCRGRLHQSPLIRMPTDGRGPGHHNGHHNATLARHAARCERVALRVPQLLQRPTSGSSDARPRPP